MTGVTPSRFFFTSGVKSSPLAAVANVYVSAIPDSPTNDTFTSASSKRRLSNIDCTTSGPVNNRVTNSLKRQQIHTYNVNVALYGVALVMRYNNHNDPSLCASVRTPARVCMYVCACVRVCVRVCVCVGVGWGEWVREWMVSRVCGVCMSACVSACVLKHILSV